MNSSLRGDRAGNSGAFRRTLVGQAVLLLIWQRGPGLWEESHALSMPRRARLSTSPPQGRNRLCGGRQAVAGIDAP